MKTTNMINTWTLLITLIIMSYAGMSQKSEGNVEILYYGIEMDGIICGYVESSRKMINENGKEWLEVADEIKQKLTVLNQNVDISISNKFKINPETGRYFFCERIYDNGSATLHSTTKVKDNIAFFTSNMDNETKELDLSDVILDSPIDAKHLLIDFIQGEEKQKTHNVLDDWRGVIVEKDYKFLKKEEIELAGNTYSTTVIEELDKSTGTKLTYWIEDETGFQLKLSFSGRTIYLADDSVKMKIEAADYNNLLFAKVDKIIPDIQSLTYMKVNAKIKSEGEWITVESLNFPGQSFTGTVTENLIEGVFEIESIRYNGTTAPGFPYDYPLSDSMQKYIEPENLIESDHPDLIKEAQNITKDATDSWDAAVSLSTWVAENIKGAIPGGTSAINTYNTREGECGSHSRLLAAFCRASNIPARLSIGCMYSSYLGGSFGQHAWTEVFMGDAGWIAVDATAYEYDFVDAGHIRLGEWTSFHPVEMEIIEYKDGNQDNVNDTIPEKYYNLVGNYTLVERNRVFRIFYQNDKLAVDLPDKMVLMLNDADENGLYYPQISRQINFRFDKDSSGKAVAMWLQQLMPIPKKAEQDTIPENATNEFRQYIGKYYLAQANIEVNIWENDGYLFINDPFTKSDTKLEQVEGTEKWKLAISNSEISFEKNNDGNVIKLIFYQNVYLTKGEPVSVFMEETIDKSGIKDAVTKYYELKSNPCDGILFSETCINQLGHKYLRAGEKINAIEIFKLNVKEYPKSWNTYDSLGEAYMKNGDDKLAIKNYNKSIKLNPNNTHGEEMLANLLEK